MPEPSRSSGSWLSRQRWLLPAVWWYLGLRALTLVGLVLGDAFSHERLVNKLTRWDSSWLLDAARHGWPRHLVEVHGHVVANTISFFPLLPLLIRWSHQLTGVPYSIVGLVLSGITGLSATLGIGLLVRQFRSEHEAARAAILVAVFPATFIFSLIYAEGLVLTFIACGLIALLRKRWLLAGLLGLLATLTSPVGLAFVVACVWASASAIRRQRAWRSLVAPLVAPLGFLAYMGWLRLHTGSFNAWRRTERGGWNSYPSLHYPVHLITSFVRDPLAQVKTTDLLIAGIAFTAVGLYWAFRQRQPPLVLAYAVASVCLALLSSPVSLRPRFILIAFPVVVAWALRFRAKGFHALVVLSLLGWAALTAFEFYSWAIFP